MAQQNMFDQNAFIQSILNQQTHFQPPCQYVCNNQFMANVPLFISTPSPPIYPLVQQQQQPQMVPCIQSTTNFNFTLQVPESPNACMPPTNPTLNPFNSWSSSQSSDLYTIQEEETNNLINPNAIPFVPLTPPPSPLYGSDNWVCNHTVTTVRKYYPEFAARAELNIFIHPTLTQMIQKQDCQIAQHFASPSAFYYYLNISTALQINDGQINVLVIDDNDQQILLIDYDLSRKGTNQTLYAVAKPNTEHTQNNNKWLWKLDSFMTATEIYKTFGILHELLPKSSRKMESFVNKLNSQRSLAQRMHLNVIRNTVWGNIQQIKLRIQRGKYGKKKSHKLRLSKQQFVRLCLDSWNKYAAIPIVVDGNKNGINAHWIEWTVIVDLCQYAGGYIGISCRYKRNNGWMVTAICMDRGDLMNKHRLIGMHSEESTRLYGEYFNNFNRKYTDIQWTKSMHY